MKKKFQIRTFEGERVEKPVANHPNIRKLWNWNNERKTYEAAGGSPYIAKRRRIVNGKTISKRQSFSDLDSAKAWMHEAAKESNLLLAQQLADSPSFGQVIEKYKRDRFGRLKPSSSELYNRYLNSKYFDFLKGFKVREIRPVVIDEWIAYLKSLPSNKNRTSFTIQFDLFRTILKYYSELDDGFISPIKPRHLLNIVVKPLAFKNTDLLEKDFLVFRNELAKLKNGLILSTLATVQYYQALRVCEAAALTEKDFVIDNANPINSRIIIGKSVRYDSKKQAAEVQNGFKNAKSNNGKKEQPLFNPSYKQLMFFLNKREIENTYLFSNPNGSLLNYRAIESAYNRAFVKAGLSFTGTHILRHGGARRLFDSTNGDWGATKQLLGNSDMRTVQIYANRSSKALTDVSKLQWNEVRESKVDPQKSTEG